MVKYNQLLPVKLMSLLTVSLLVGCGGEFQLAPVAGEITLDGEPLVNAAVYFQPQRNGDNQVVGPPSLGVTDESGHYSLKNTEQYNGALVGKHIVSISTFESRMVDPKNSDRLEIVSKERVPKRYRAPSELTIEVPSGGIDTANFDLQSR